MVVGTDEFSEPFGDRQQEVFEQINQMLQAEGFDGAIFVGGADEALSSKGWQYSYSYTLGAMDDGYRNIVNINKYASQSGTAPYIPTVTQGWGNEAWGLQYRKVNIPIKDCTASRKIA